jgi:Transposase DNA-binding
MLPSLPSALWAAQVAAATPLPDGRLNARLERLLTHLAQKPLDALPQALPDCHQAKASYRFLANDRVGRDDLLTGWRATTAQALRGHDVIYVAHDTTTFNYSTLKQTTGLGYISDLAAARGFHCHSSLALRRDGVALGLLHQYYWIRTELKKARPQGRALPDKESIKWLQPQRPWQPCRRRNVHASSTSWTARATSMKCLSRSSAWDTAPSFAATATATWRKAPVTRTKPLAPRLWWHGCA